MRKFLRRQDKGERKRPSHRARARSPLPAIAGRDDNGLTQEKNLHIGKRSFPGRLTLEEWLAVPFRERMPLVWRAQCDLLGSFRFCTNKRCRRERTCCGDDPQACLHRLWLLRKVKPKTLRRERARLDSLMNL